MLGMYLLTPLGVDWLRYYLSSASTFILVLLF